MLKSHRTTLGKVQFEHALFALPPAFPSAFPAVHGLPIIARIGWTMLAMVGVRSATMSFNRLIDLPLVSRIPCTAIRALPQKQSGKRFAITSAPWVSGLLQAFMVILVALVLLRSGLCLLGLASLGPVTVLLTYEHSLIRPTDLGQVNAAFFTVDSWIGVLLSVATGIDIPWRRVS